LLMLLVRRNVLLALLSDPEWRKRLERARTSEEAERVVVRFCRETGLKVAEVGEEEPPLAMEVKRVSE